MFQTKLPAFPRKWKMPILGWPHLRVLLNKIDIHVPGIFIFRRLRYVNFDASCLNTIIWLLMKRQCTHDIFLLAVRTNHSFFLFACPTCSKIEVRKSFRKKKPHSPGSYSSVLEHFYQASLSTSTYIATPAHHENIVSLLLSRVNRNSLTVPLFLKVPFWGTSYREGRPMQNCPVDFASAT
ncbi:hypothetical protein BC830DRAFT_361067 [Chytriomyces sp. MP71]|nr:hypothetical protein BC830DRAFT_361067 [Chytriomyces sp. MP71]